MQILVWIGIALIVIGGLGFFIAAFKESVLWGLGCIVFPIIQLVFLVMHWREAKTPFLLQVFGIVIVGIAVGLGDRWEPSSTLWHTSSVGRPGGCRIKGNMSFTTGERLYHVPGGKWYDETRIDTSGGERWFCSEEEARAAGWRRSYE